MAVHMTPPHRTLSDLLDLYQKEFLPHKAPTTQRQLKGLYVRIREDLGTIALQDLTPLIVRTWRDRLSQRYQPGMVRRYLDTLSGPLTAAVREYDWLTQNPVHKIRKPAIVPGRVRFLTDEERQRLLLATGLVGLVGYGWRRRQHPVS